MNGFCRHRHLVAYLYERYLRQSRIVNQLGQICEVLELNRPKTSGVISFLF